MSDLLKGFVKKELSNEIKETYPHLQYPGALLARVISALGSEGNVTCTIKIIDKNGDIDQRFPEIPLLKTDMPVTTNDIVVIVLLYGTFTPFIVGRYLE